MTACQEGSSNFNLDHLMHDPCIWTSLLQAGSYHVCVVPVACILQQAPSQHDGPTALGVAVLTRATRCCVPVWTRLQFWQPVPHCRDCTGDGVRSSPQDVVCSRIAISSAGYDCRSQSCHVGPARPIAGVCPPEEEAASVRGIKSNCEYSKSNFYGMTEAPNHASLT